jgi:DNA-binding NarL/FixJ family response regulator
MDIHMPKMDGVTATMLIKAQNPEIVVVGLSVDLKDYQLYAMQQAGALTVIRKGSPVAELYAALQEKAVDVQPTLVMEETSVEMKSAKATEELSLAPRSKTSLGMTVLFVDSKLEERQCFANELYKCSPDYQILQAADGRSALQLYQRNRIDCVVLELTLSDVSSFEVLVKLVPRVKVPDVAVIVLTAVSFEPALELARRNGAQACLVKSQTSVEQLDTAIRKAVNAVGSRQKENYRQSP